MASPEMATKNPHKMLFISAAEFKALCESPSFQARSVEEKEEFYRKTLIIRGIIPLMYAGAHPLLEALDGTPDFDVAQDLYYSGNIFSITSKRSIIEVDKTVRSLSKLQRKLITTLCLDLRADLPKTKKALENERKEADRWLSICGWNIEVKVVVPVMRKGSQIHITSDLEPFGDRNADGHYVWKDRPYKDGTPRKRKQSDDEADETESTASTAKRHKTNVAEGLNESDHTETLPGLRQSRSAGARRVVATAEKDAQKEAEITEQLRNIRAPPRQ